MIRSSDFPLGRRQHHGIPGELYKLVQGIVGLAGVLKVVLQCHPLVSDSTAEVMSQI